MSMGAAVTDERCRALRVKLNKHCYHQTLSEDSVLLVETMLNDLIASTAGLNDLKRRDTEGTERLQSLISELEVFRIENPRLQAENNALHLQIIESDEATETWEDSVRTAVRKLEDEIEAVKLTLQKEASAQQLHAIELERTDIARLHEHVCLQTREYEVALQRLQHDRERARRAAGELAKEVQRIKGLEDTWHGSAEQCQLDMRVMQEQLAEIAQRIQRSEQTQREALEADAKLKGDVAAATAAAQGADHSQASQAQQVAALRLRRHQLQTAVQQARGEAATQHRLAEQERHQVRRLEALLEGGQMKLQRSTADLEALRRCLEHQRSPAALGSSVQESPSVNELKQQVEREYSKVGELDAEQQSLQAEVLRLRAELRRLKGLKPT
ncbi:Cep135 [Symbiodinium sp. CCMP2456]|nr:Cep135 [Symbiodinium sp. CCMP2456]